MTVENPTPKEIEMSKRIRRVIEAIIPPAVLAARHVDNDSTLLPSAFLGASISSAMMMAIPGHERRAIMALRTEAMSLCDQAIKVYDDLRREEIVKGES